MVGTGVSRYTTDPPPLPHQGDFLVTCGPYSLQSTVLLVSLDLGQTRGAESLVSMLSHIHVRSIALDVMRMECEVVGSNPPLGLQQI